MNNGFIFSSTPPVGVDEKYVADADGYYHLRAGSFNVKNSVGDFYPMDEELMELFKGHGELMTTVKAGKLYAELGHPKYDPGMSDDEWIERNLLVDEGNTIAHIRDVQVITGLPASVPFAKDRVDIYIDAKPFGVHKQIMIDSFTNPAINTAFSLRNLYLEKVIGNMTYRFVRSVITWDFVLLNGVERADKFSVGAESYSPRFTREELKRAVVSIKDNKRLVGHESAVKKLEAIDSVCSGGSCLLKHL